MKLSPREKQVVDLLLLGKSNKQIAFVLGVSERTIEFHLKNVYIKLNVASRVELILKLRQTTASNSVDLVESTVDIEHTKLDNGNQPTRLRAAQSLRNTLSLIKQELAMTIKISFEDLHDFLKSRPLFFSLLLFLAIGFTTRIILFEIGLFFWLSYVLLGIALSIIGIYIGRSWKKMFVKKTNLFFVMGFVISLPFIATSIDQLYINLILPYTQPISTSIAGISAEAIWVDSYRSTHLSITSDVFWYITIAYVLALFLIGYFYNNRFKRNDLIMQA